jgi:hypothetical protein
MGSVGDSCTAAHIVGLVGRGGGGFLKRVLADRADFAPAVSAR